MPLLGQETVVFKHGLAPARYLSVTEVAAVKVFTQ